MTILTARFAHAFSALDNVTDLALAGPVTLALLEDIPLMIKVVNKTNTNTTAIVTVWPSQQSPLGPIEGPHPWSGALVITDALNNEGRICVLTQMKIVNDKPTGCFWIAMDNPYMRSQWFAAMLDLLANTGFEQTSVTKEARNEHWTRWDYVHTDSAISTDEHYPAD